MRAPSVVIGLALGLAPAVVPRHSAAAAAAEPESTGGVASAPAPAASLPAGTAAPARPEPWGFAESLLEDGDYYRAIGEYRRFLYLHGKSAPAEWTARDDAALGPHAAPLADTLSKWPRALPHRSPLAAGLLSIIPGLGHLYLGEPRLALVAFLWNGLWMFAAGESFHRRAWGAGVAFSLVTLVWYSGTVFGAVSGAHRFNRDAVIEGLDALRDEHPVAPW